MRTRYKIASDVFSYFITSTIVNWIPLFTSEKYFMVLLDAVKFYQSNSDLQIFSYVIMPEHFHLVAKSKELSKTLQLIKMYSAKKIIAELKKDCNINVLEKLQAEKRKHKKNSLYQIWQEGFKPKEIHNKEMFEQKTNYIHYNPVKRGLVLNAADWKYSSAGFYENGTKCFIEIAEYF